MQSIVIGTFGGFDSPVTIVGSSMSIIAFDFTGEEVFWTLTGANVNCLDLFDIDGDGRNELLVGSSDYAIRFFKDENNYYEKNENQDIIFIKGTKRGTYLYALENGTLGCYMDDVRKWKQNQNGVVQGVQMTVYKAEVHLVVGWSTGKLQLLLDKDGTTVWEQQLEAPIYSVLYGDLNQSSINQFIVTLETGNCCFVTSERVHHSGTGKVSGEGVL